MAIGAPRMSHNEPAIVDAVVAAVGPGLRHFVPKVCLLHAAVSYCDDPVEKF